MAEKEAKIATVIIKVDLECSCCSKKIKCAICKLQKRFKINSIIFDEKKNTVTVSGAFNPDCFIKKICCLAHKVIKDIEIKKEEPKPKPKPEEPKPTPPPEVKIAIRTCCSQPCPCYMPHQGCCRCCSCGYVFSDQSGPQQCPKPCPEPCPLPCPKPCPQQSSKPCPKPCSKPCPQTCPEPCPEQCPLPYCQPWPQPFPLPCPQKSSKPCPKPCSKPCPETCPEQCPLPYCQPWPQPCPLPSQFGGYPCYNIVCEDEASGGCSIM